MTSPAPAPRSEQIDIRVKRVYEDPSPEDGTRVLVDRLWPRGISRERAAVAEWTREVAPSADLRKWFGHDPSRRAEFVRRYEAELDERPEAVEGLLERARKGRLTLVYSARDEDHNQAVALAAYLRERG